MEELTWVTIHTILELLVLHLIEMLKIDLSPTGQLQCLEDLEVEELKLIIGDQRCLTQIEDLLASIIDHSLRETHQVASKHLGALTRDDVLAPSDDVE